MPNTDLDEVQAMQKYETLVLEVMEQFIDRPSDTDTISIN